MKIIFIGSNGDGASSIMMYKLGMQNGDLLKGWRMWLRQVDFTQFLPKAMMSLGKSALPQDKKKIGLANMYSMNY